MNIELKRWNETDFASIGRIFTECDRSFLTDGLPMPYTREHAEGWYNMRIRERDGKDGLYRIIHINSQPAGVITIERKEGTNFSFDADLSYLLLESFKGQGAMTRAVDMLCAQAFAQLNILRISASVFSPNAASCRVLEKNGFVLEGRIRRGAIKGGNMYDLLVYGKLK